MTESVEDRARAASVRVIVSLNTPYTWAGSGGLVRYAFASGEFRDYVVTNAHVVSAHRGETRVPGGTVVDGELYYPVRRPNGSAAYGRLVSYNPSPICNAGNELSLGADYRDMAILELVDPRADPARFDKIRQAVDPLSYRLDEKSDASDNSRRFDGKPYDFDQLWRQGETPSGDYLDWGFPGDKSGAIESSKGRFSAKASDATIRGVGQDSPGRLQLDFDNPCENVRPGYSGSFVVDQGSGLPVGIYTGGASDGWWRGYATPIRPALEKIRDIENARARGEYVGVGVASVPLCRSDELHWRETRRPAPQGDTDGYEARLARAAEMFRRQEVEASAAWTPEQRAERTAPIPVPNPGGAPAAACQPRAIREAVAR